MKYSIAIALTGLAITACAAPPPAVPFSSGPDSLLPPVRLEAGGAPIDMGGCIGCAGPHLLDLDEDGLQDLLVGDFVGHMHVFRNTTSNESPVYAPGRMLEANGEVIEIPNW